MISKREALDFCCAHLRVPSELRRLIDHYFILTEFDNVTIRVAVDLWTKSKIEAIECYGDISEWNTSKVTDMDRLFYMKGGFNDDISMWDVSNVTSMKETFACTYRFNQPLNSWNVSNVADMSYMFYRAIGFNQPLDQWDVSNVATMGYMFQRTENFNQPSIAVWNIANVRHMEMIFCDAKAFKQSLLEGHWNTPVGKSAISTYYGFPFD